MPDSRPNPPLAFFTYSQSSLQDYADCPRRFQLRYLDQLKWPGVETEPALENEKRQLEGQVFHRLVQQHLVGIPAERLGKLANTPDLSRWWENYLGDANLQSLKDFGNLYPELSLSAPVSGTRLMAKFDLVAVNPDGKALIYDWKTYQKRTRDEWLAARWQTRVYRSLLVQAGSHLNGGRPILPEKVEMVYWFANYPDDPARFVYTSAQFKRDWSAITRIVDEIAASGEFPMTEDDSRCRFCPYRSYCDRGVAAGDLGDIEAEAEPDEVFDINFEQIGEIEF